MEKEVNRDTKETKEIKESNITKLTIKIGDEDRVVEVHKPTPKIEAEGNMASSKVFARLIKEKDEDGKTAFILRSQLNAHLADIGIYSDQDIEDINTFGDRIKELEELLAKGGKKKSEGKAASIELRRTRYAVYALLMRQSEFDKNTVEHYADNARMSYLVTKCICFEGGAPIWTSVDDYESDAILQEALAEAIQTLAGMISQYDPDFEKNLPENKFLKKYGFCDDKYRLVNKDGQLVDTNGNLIDDKGELVEKVEAPETVGEFLDEDEDEPVAEPVEDGKPVPAESATPVVEKLDIVDISVDPNVEVTPDPPEEVLI